jgi:hypothetical protein
VLLSLLFFEDDDFPVVEPVDVLPVVVFDVLDLAFVEDDLEVEPDALLSFLEIDDESLPEEEVDDDVGLLLLLPIDVFDDDDDDDGILDDPLDIFDDWFELWFFSVSFIVVISLFMLKIKFVACPTQLSLNGQQMWILLCFEFCQNVGGNTVY